MDDYQYFQKNYYEEEWGKLKLAAKPGATGWRTGVPAPDFLDFIHWLKKEKICGRALDIGCGGGRHSIVLAKEGFEAYSIDFSTSAIKAAKDNSRKAKVEGLISFQVGDALHLPYKDKLFDIINDDGCFHHISKDDWDKYIENVVRVLKKNGILRIKAFSKSCPFYTKNKPRGSENHWILVPGADYTYFFDKVELISLFEDRFEIIKLVEKYHSVTTEKKFFFIILKKK